MRKRTEGHFWSGIEKMRRWGRTSAKQSPSASPSPSGLRMKLWRKARSEWQGSRHGLWVGGLRTADWGIDSVVRLISGKPGRDQETTQTLSF